VLDDDDDYVHTVVERDLKGMWRGEGDFVTLESLG
jgi:hypothetical protein